MHECPDCGQACSCDGEDTWWNDYPGCCHECDEDFDDEDCYGSPDEEDEQEIAEEE